MSYLLPHLHSGWAVDQAILGEEERAVVIRFGHDWDETCMQVCSHVYEDCFQFESPAADRKQRMLVAEPHTDMKPSEVV
ncbi:hypothetical protein L7F22_050703 [Adiantum nelumboides]|nr:hypothetical protein [Adiantum nelumboides]